MSFRIAFAKGRGAAECIRLLDAGGVVLPEYFHTGKPAVYSSPKFDLLCVLVRGRDIVKLLEDGHVDVAIGSRLIFEERGSSEIFPAAPLDIGVCRFSLITQDLRPIQTLRKICTRYPRTTMKMLHGIPTDARIVELGGCVEAGLFLGVGDAITDVVETGFTLESLSLLERQVLSRFNHEVWLRNEDSDLHMEKLRNLMPSVSWATSEEAMKVKII